MVKRLAGAAAAVLATAGMAASAAQAATFFDVAKLPKPPLTGKQIVDDTDSFATTFTGRYTGTPIETNAAAFLSDDAKSLGYQVQILELPARDGAPAAVTHAVVATRKGTTKPDENLIFIAHYDQFPGVSGSATYDNGSGTNMVRALARSIARVPTNRTVVFAWYNGEEEGALSSDPHSKQFAAAKTNVRAVLGFDMVGIAWPVANPTAGTTCLCVWWGDGDDGFEPLLRHVNFDVLGFPDKEGEVQVVGANDRNSDEASWDAAGYPTLRWAGMRTAASYPQYHMPLDNLDTMVSTAGTRENLDQGNYNTLLSAYDTALSLDNEMPVARATTSGERTIRFDGTSSSDPDGPISSWTWDFGDGSTGSGPAVEHSYARPGTYVAKLKAADNLHPEVTDSTAVEVTVAASPTAVKKKPSKKATCLKKAKKVKNAKKRKAAKKRCAKLK